MNFSSSVSGRFLGGSTLLSLMLLAGCQGEKIVARVGNDPIKESEFYGRAIRMNAETIAAGMDAGGAAMVGMIREKMTAQLAAAKNAVPTEDQVSRYVAYQIRVNPQIKTALEKGQVTEEDIKRGVRFSLEEFGIGTEGAKAADNEVRAEYDRLLKEKNIISDPLNGGREARNEVKLPETWYLRTLQVPSEAAGKQVIETLKTKPDLTAIAMANGASPLQAQQATQEIAYAKEALLRQLPALEKELETVGPGQFTTKPVAVTMPPNPQAPNTQPTTAYLVVQVTRKEPEYTFQYDEVRPVLEQRLLSIKHKDWFTHKEQEMAKFTSDLVNKDGIKINLKQYQSVLDSFIRQMAKLNLPTAPGGTLSPNPNPAAPAPNGTAPQPAPGAGAPPK